MNCLQRMSPYRADVLRDGNEPLISRAAECSQTGQRAQDELAGDHCRPGHRFLSQLTPLQFSQH